MYNTDDTEHEMTSLNANKILAQIQILKYDLKNKLQNTFLLRFV